MKNKSILIEKYIEQSYTIPETNERYGAKVWIDRNDELHSFMGHPAYVIYNNGQIIEQHWYKKGVEYRDGDLPAVIFYENGQIAEQQWYKKGKLHRDRDLPAKIIYYEGKIRRQFWHKNGEFIKEKFY